MADACLWQSAWNIFQAQSNLNKLWEALDTINGDTESIVIEYYDEDKSKGEFIQPVWNAYYAVYGSRHTNARKVGWLTFAIQLTCIEGEEADWEFGQRAKVFVGYSPYSDYDSAWEFDERSPNSAGYFEDCDTNETHWTWTTDDGGEIYWFYGVPLDCLTSTAQVREFISDPVRKILAGCEPAVVLKEIKNGLCLPPRS